jgi:hypothetical protein
MPDIQVPVYHMIYDHIMTLEDFLSHTAALEYQPFEVRKYDLTTVIQPGDIIPPQKLAAMWEWISLNSRYAATNYFSGVYEPIPNIMEHKEFESGGHPFSIIIFR